MTKITWLKKDSAEYLDISFSGVFTYENAQQASQEWKDQFNTKPGQQINVIFNALKMDSYEPLSRAVWQKTIKELSPQIYSIWLVTDSKLIAAGAKIMSIFTTFRINTVSSEAEIYQSNSKFIAAETLPVMEEALV